jgi:hypothetical protein
MVHQHLQVKPLLSPEPPANPPTPQKAFQIVQKAIFNELVQLVDGSAGKDGAGVGAGGDGKGWEFKPKKGKPNVLMAVGIQVRPAIWVLRASSRCRRAGTSRAARHAGRLM